MKNKIFYLMLLFALSSLSIYAQVFDKTEYKAFKISNSKIEKGPDFLQVKVVQNPLTFLYTFYDQSNNALSGRYHFIVNYNKHMVVELDKGYINGDLKVFFYNVEQERYSLRKGINHGKQSIFATNEFYNYDNGILVDYTEFYNNSQLKKQLNYKDGKIHGQVIEYFQDGSLKSSKVYLSGILNGTVIEKDLFGNSKEANFKNDILQGPYQEKNSKGQITLKGDYKNNKKTGSWLYYDADGIIHKQAPYLDGKYHGLVKTYYNGSLYSSENYDNGVLQGQRLEYQGPLNNRTVCKEEFYTKGERDGNQKYFNSKGVLYLEVGYENGQRIFSKEYDVVSGLIQGETLYRGNLSIAYKDYDKQGTLKYVQVRDENGDFVVVQEYSPKGEVIVKNKKITKTPDVKMVEDKWGIIDIL